MESQPRRKLKLAFPSALGDVRSLTFDLMGTCTDWHTSILHALVTTPDLPLDPPLDYSQLALDWRAGFFQAIFTSFQRGEQAPDIDLFHRQVLDRLLSNRGVNGDIWGDDVREHLVRAWHHQLGQLMQPPILT